MSEPPKVDSTSAIVRETFAQGGEFIKTVDKHSSALTWPGIVTLVGLVMVCVVAGVQESAIVVAISMVLPLVGVVWCIVVTRAAVKQNKIEILVGKELAAEAMKRGVYGQREKPASNELPAAVDLATIQRLLSTVELEPEAAKEAALRDKLFAEYEARRALTQTTAEAQPTEALPQPLTLDCSPPHAGEHKPA